MRHRELLAVAALALIAIGSLYRDVRFQAASADRRPVSPTRQTGTPWQRRRQPVDASVLPRGILDTLHEHGVLACLEAHLEGEAGTLTSFLTRPKPRPKCAQATVDASFLVCVTVYTYIFASYPKQRMPLVRVSTPLQLFGRQ